MQSIKNQYAYVLKSIKKDKTLKPVYKNLSNKTYIVSGATRGIGYNISKKLALNGANVIMLGKTIENHPKLDNTIFSAADDINELCKDNKCVPIACDIRNHSEIDDVINQTKSYFGTINGAVLNASALCLKNTIDQTNKDTMLMSSVNINGTYLMGQKCIQLMYKNFEPSHLLIIAPPLDMLYDSDWWTNHFYYSMSKFNMSLMAKFWNKEFYNVAVNTLWPRTTINTAPVKNILGGDEMINISRTTDIMGDAALNIFLSNPLICNGKNFIDDEVLTSLDIDLQQYKVNKHVPDKDLMPDFFC